jgi:hypothetical protein
VRSKIHKGLWFVRLTNLVFAIREINPILDGVRLTDAQKRRLASQNEDCHSKKTFLGASSGTVRGAKKNCFMRTQEFMFLVRSFWVF